MESKVSYAMVGVFVVALGAIFIAAILWLAGGLQGRKNYVLYQSTVNESVAGLNIDAPVKYIGVDVGKVQSIKLDPLNQQQVQLFLAIEQGTPVKQDTVAVLKTQGLTGIAYVELNGGAPNSPPLLAAIKGHYPMIRSTPSLSRRLENVLTTTLANVDRTANEINSILDSDNRAAFKSILADTALLMHSLAEQRTVISTGVTNMAKTADYTARATQQLNPLIHRITQSVTALEMMGKDVSQASHSATRSFELLNGGIKAVTGDTLPEIGHLLEELGILSETLRQLSDQTERNPNSVLWGNPLRTLGPGEQDVRR